MLYSLFIATKPLDIGKSTRDELGRLVTALLRFAFVTWIHCVLYIGGKIGKPTHQRNSNTVT
jgi:hypothetical protein